MAKKYSFNIKENDEQTKHLTMTSLLRMIYKQYDERKAHMTEEKAKPGTYVSAMKDFFGLKTGQTLTQFSAELKSLSPDEQAFFKQGLRANGYPIPME
jgi:hypothetical protein